MRRSGGGEHKQENRKTGTEGLRIVGPFARQHPSAAPLGIMVQKVGRSGGQEVRRSRGQDVRRSGEQENKRTAREGLRIVGPFARQHTSAAPLGISTWCQALSDSHLPPHWFQIYGHKYVVLHERHKCRNARHKVPSNKTLVPCI